MAFKSPFLLAAVSLIFVVEVSAQKLSNSFQALLPDAPGATLLANQAAQATTGRISGQAADATGTAIESCRALLLDSSNKPLKDMDCREHGVFSFNDLSSGEYKVVVTAPGFRAYDSGVVNLGEGQSLETSIKLTLETVTTEVEVKAYDHAIAEAQIQAEMKQRVLGVIPNFYTSFEYEAVPLTPGQKFHLATRATLDPFHFIGSAVVAGVQQSRNTYPEWGDDAAGYGKRYGAALALSLSSDMLNHAVFPVIFKQDPRYFYQGTGSFGSRFLHGISYAIMLRNDNGKTAPNYSYILGGLAVGGLSNAIYPKDDRGVGLLFTNAAISLGGRAARGVFREFLSGSITTHRAGKGKPAPVSTP